MIPKSVYPRQVKGGERCGFFLGMISIQTKEITLPIVIRKQNKRPKIKGVSILNAQIDLVNKNHAHVVGQLQLPRAEILV